jgi:hypothetical protein
VGVTGDELLRRRVRLRGIDLGRAVDLILAPDGRRVVGFDVRCGDSEHRFLAWPAAILREGHIDVSSVLVMLDEEELAFYTARGTGLLALRRQGRVLDVVVGRGGEIVELVVQGEAGPERVSAALLGSRPSEWSARMP